MIRVSPDEKAPTHDFSFSDPEGHEIGLISVDSQGNHAPLAVSGASTIRTAVKTTTGNTKYSDFEAPYSPIAQDDWANGRGGEDFDDDPARFMDSYRCNSLQGTIMLGPQATYTKGFRDQDFSLPGSLTWHSMLSGATKYLALKFTASASYSAAAIYLHLRRRGTPADLTVELCADSGGNPDTVLQTATVTTTNVTDTIAVFYKAAITAESLTSGTAYWVKVYATTSSDNDYWQVGVKNASGTTKQSAAGTVWAACAFDLYYRVTAVDVAPARMKFFTYKRAAWCVKSADTGAPVLYLNGDIGAADANTGALTTLIDGTKSWVTNEWAGAIVILIGGPGSNETKPWRTITSNNSTTLTLDSTWVVEHTAATE